MGRSDIATGKVSHKESFVSGVANRRVRRAQAAKARKTGKIPTPPEDMSMGTVVPHGGCADCDKEKEER